MPTFAYLAVNALGQEVKGAVEAVDGNEATAKVKELGYLPTRVTLTESRSAGSANPPLDRASKDILLPTFDYSAVNENGQQVKGSIDAADVQDAQAKIKAKGLFPTRVIEASKANSRGPRQFFTMLLIGLIAWAAVRSMLKTFRGEGPPPPSASAPIIPS